MSSVLIVEDSPTQAQTIQYLLEDAGFQVSVAGQGLEALASIGQALPDIVVTDLEMPQMNGLQLVEAVRRDYPTVPVILMTAHGSEEIAALALRQGAASYVPKIHLEQDLVATIARILAVTKVDSHNRLALECLVAAESNFLLHNDPALITPIIGHLEDVLARLRLCDATERMRTGVALQEALLNAIYHGNLEVSSELRQEDEKKFHAMVQERRGAAPYRTRRIQVSAKITPDQAIYTVRDEGPGFDPSDLPDPTDLANLERVGGRGLLLIRTFMDKVYHNETGNEITLIKKRQKL